MFRKIKLYDLDISVYIGIDEYFQWYVKEYSSSLHGKKFAIQNNYS